MIPKEYLTQSAYECQLSDAGAIQARVFDELIPVLKRRQTENRMTAFEEKDTLKRINPYLLMPGVQSIVVVITSYYAHPTPGTERPDFYGELAAFARGTDYHRVLHGQMNRLGEKLRHVSPTLEWQSYADTGPLVDRYLASQAGLGIYGRNNCLIHPELGSFIVIGYMLISDQVSDSADEPQALHACSECGSCQRACPVQALEQPFVIDPDRCLSHLLQRKDKIPLDLRQKAGSMLYGCDICQNVCPHNRGIPVTREPSFLSSSEDKWIDIEPLLQLSNRKFNRHYGSTAFRWRGQKILQRNALLALGNSDNPRAADLIKPFLVHRNNELREMAGWALSQHTTEIQE